KPSALNSLHYDHVAWLLSGLHKTVFDSQASAIWQGGQMKQQESSILPSARIHCD
ncbi:hypothetical protein P7K49_003813, partial [Saguinus oedipus]